MHFLVLQHLRVEHPGSLRDFWKRDGITWDAVEFEDGETIPGDLGKYDALVVMGGSMDVWDEDKFAWLTSEKAAIRQFVRDLNKPFLGICLGHQLLADALGGQVELGARAEVGFVPVQLSDDAQSDPLFKGLPPSLQTFQWHGAEVTRMPEGSRLLASSEACLCQAFRWRRAYGLQFHAEITRDTVPDWSAIPEYKAYLQRELGLDGDQRLAKLALAALPSFEAIAAKLHKNFMTIVSENAPA